MTHFSRAFTGLTSLAIGIFFILLTTASLRATAIHAQTGNTTSASITLGSAFLLFFAALFFALPTPRNKLIYATFSVPARILFASLGIGVFGVIAALLAAAPNVSGNPVLLGASQNMVLAAIGCLAVAFLVTFLMPGFAYSEVRAAYRETREIERSRAISHDGGHASAQEKLYRSPLTKLLGGIFGLASLTIMGLALYGLMFAQFISSAAHVELVKENSVWIILGCGIIFLGSLHFGRTRRGGIRNPVLRGVFMVVFAAPFSFLAIPAAQIGVPALMSLQEDGRYDKIQVTVVKQGRASSRRSCDHKATVVWEVHNRQLCNVPEQIWRDLSPGQTLELEGFQTDYGFRYERMRRRS